MAERRVDTFELPRTQARYTIESSRGVDDNPAIARTSQQLHGRCYVAFGYFTEEGLETDGRLVPELDGTREDAEGLYEVSYLLAKTADGQEAGATLRLIGVKEGGSVYDLPTCRYGLSDEAYAQIGAATGENGVVREIAALAVADRNHSVGSYELMRSVMQNALINRVETGQKEVYIASLTRTSLRPVSAFTGDAATRIIDDAVSIFSTDPRAKDITVYPVLIDPFVMIETAIQEAKEGVSQGSSRELKRLAFLMDGLGPSEIPDSARTLLVNHLSQ